MRPSSLIHIFFFILFPLFFCQCATTRVVAVKTNDKPSASPKMYPNKPDFISDAIVTKKDTIEGFNAFVDISHHQQEIDLKIAQEAGLVGFFHKATQGAGFVDPAYGKRVSEARELGLLLGAYHFGTGEPVNKQVDAFLSVIEKYGHQSVLPVLDWEPNPISTQGTMSKKQAAEFINLFWEKTGVYPMLYGGYWMLGVLGKIRTEEDLDPFSKAPLWQAFYSSAFGYLSDIWDTWTFLQYTDGSLGPEPHELKGIGKVDRNVFNGTREDAIKFWHENSLKEIKNIRTNE